MKKPFLALSLALIGFLSFYSVANTSDGYTIWTLNGPSGTPYPTCTAILPLNSTVSDYVYSFAAECTSGTIQSVPSVVCPTGDGTSDSGSVSITLRSGSTFSYSTSCTTVTPSSSIYDPETELTPNPNNPGSGGGPGSGSGSQFPPGSPFCIDNPNSPLCENNDNPDLCGIGIGSAECCTAHAVNTCADQGGVYYSNYQQQGNDGHCQVQCWAWTELPPVTNPEPDYDGFPNADSCYDYAENYCGSGSVWSALYNNNSKSCSVMCSDGTGGDVPDPTAPPPGTPPPPNTNPNPGGNTIIPGQNGDIYVNNDYSGVVDSINGMRQNMDSRLGSLIAAVNNNAPLDEFQTRNAVEQGTGNALNSFFDVNPDTVGTLWQQADNSRAGELETQRNAYGLGDRDFSDIPERIVNLDDFTDDYDFSIDGTCPEFWTVQILGETYELDLGPFCTILDLIGTLLVFASYVAAARIAYGGLN